MTIADLISRATESDASRPAVTFYDLSTGERVELSVATTTNWVAKTANMLQDTLGSDDDTTVDLWLPLHWETVVWFLATWAAGATVRLAETDDAAGGAAANALAVVDPAMLETATGADDVVALSLRPLGGRFTTALPAGVIDYNAEVLAHGDHFSAYYPPSGSSPALRNAHAVTTHAELVSAISGTYAAGDRVLLVGDRDITQLAHAVPAVLDAAGSLVLVRTANPVEDAARIDDIVAAERVTVR